MKLLTKLLHFAAAASVSQDEKCAKCAADSRDREMKAARLENGQKEFRESGAASRAKRCAPLRPRAGSVAVAVAPQPLWPQSAMGAMAELLLPAGVNASTFPAKLWHLVNSPRVRSVRWDSRGQGLFTSFHSLAGKVLALSPAGSASSAIAPIADCGHNARGARPEGGAALGPARGPALPEFFLPLFQPGCFLLSDPAVCSTFGTFLIMGDRSSSRKGQQFCQQFHQS